MIARKGYMREARWYVFSTLFWGLPPERWFELAGSHGLAGLEIWVQQLQSEGISPERIGRLREKSGLALTVHSFSWDLNLISLSRPMRRMAVKLSKRAVDMAAQMGADQVTVHPGREGLLLPGVDFDAMQAEAAASIGQYGKKSGVSVSFEIMEKIPKERFTSAEAVLRMERCAKRGGCWGYTEDLAHCDTEEEVFRTAQVLSGRLKEFHVSNKKGKARHVADVRGGDFDLPSITHRLTKYELPMVLEGYDPSGPAERFETTWKWLTEA